MVSLLNTALLATTILNSSGNVSVVPEAITSTPAAVQSWANTIISNDTKTETSMQYGGNTYVLITSGLTGGSWDESVNSANLNGSTLNVTVSGGIGGPILADDFQNYYELVEIPCSAKQVTITQTFGGVLPL